MRRESEEVPLVLMEAAKAVAVKEVNVTEAPGTIAAKALAVKKENVEVGTGDVVSGKSDGRSETREAEAASRRR